MDERQSFQWQDLNSGCTSKMRAGHAYETRRPAPESHLNLSGLAKVRLLVATLVGVSIALAIVHVLATGLWL